MAQTVVQNLDSIAAGANSGNVMADTNLDYMPFPGKLSIAVNGDSGTASPNYLTIIIGDKVIVQDQLLNVKAAFPVAPDDFIYSAGADLGDKIDIRVRNGGTAAATDVYLVVKAIPVGGG